MTARSIPYADTGVNVNVSSGSVNTMGGIQLGSIDGPGGGGGGGGGVANLNASIYRTFPTADGRQFPTPRARSFPTT